MAEAGPMAIGAGGQATRGVIVCADDFAINASASMAVAKLARLGRISATSATSAMVLSPRR